MSDESKKWTPAAFTEMLGRQIAELQKAKAEMQLDGQNPDDNAEMLHALLEIRAFKKDLEAIEAEIERERKGGNADEGSEL